MINIFQAIRQRLFGNQTGVQMPSNLPQVHLFGFEKAYGAPQPNDFNNMVANNKSWAYACAMKNAFSVAKCDLKIYKKRKDDELEQVKTHPFLDLLKNVNAFSNKFELMTLTQVYLELTGNSYWWIPRSDLRIPTTIWNIPAHWMKIVPDPKKFIAGYVMRVPGKGEMIPFEEEEIVHFRFPSPFNLFYGSGPLLAAAYGIDLNTQIKTWGINFFMNNAQPSGVLYSDTPISQQNFDRLRDNWNKKHRGADNAGKIAILDSGLKYQQTGSSIKDAKFEDVSRGIRDEILAMFGVPASKLGLVEDVNRANADANDYTYQKETVLPRLTLLEEKISEKIMPIYDTDLIVKFDSPVPQDTEFALRERQINIQSGFSSIDEEREKEGLAPYKLPETSVPLIPFSLTPAGQPKPDLGLNAPPPKSIEKDIIQKSRDSKWESFALATGPQERLFAETMKRFFADQHGEVMRNLNKYRETSSVVTKDISSYILFNMREANEKLKQYSLQSTRNAFITGLVLGMKDTNSTIDFNLFEPNIVRAVKGRLDFFAEKVNDNTFSLISDTIQQGLEKGESINDISKRIDVVFEYSRNHRSKTTAQTEVIGATNEGQLKAYQEAGFESKEWLSARDEKVRDSHQIDGQVVNSTESFTTKMGSKLQYPGDRSSGAPASDIINCRCTVLPKRKKES